MYKNQFTNRYFLWLIALECLFLFLFLPLVGWGGQLRSIKPKERVPTKKPQIEKAPGPGFGAPTVTTPDYGEVELDPNSITITWDEGTLTLGRGQRGVIEVPEGYYSSGVPARVQYTLKNKTSKNFRFHVRVYYDNRKIVDNDVILYGNQSKMFTHQVTLQPTSDYKRFVVYGPRANVPGDDTYPYLTFFLGYLYVRVYPL